MEIWHLLDIMISEPVFLWRLTAEKFVLSMTVVPGDVLGDHRTPVQTAGMHKVR